MIVTLVAVAAACGRLSDPQQPSAQAPADVPVGTSLGQRAPDFTLKDLDGNPVSLSDFRGQPVLLNFMHTWCQPCNASAPDMATAYEANRETGFVILSVDVQEPADATHNFISRYGLTYPFVLDPNGEIVRQYGVRAVPTSFFLDADGIIRSTQPGEISRNWIDQNLAAVSQS